MRSIKPPEPILLQPSEVSVFLAGSIEMGAAEPWQSQVEVALNDLSLVLLNPRRDAWDANWPQRIDFAPFREQVAWELQAQEMATIVAFYFAPDSKAPITLLELGLAAGSHRRAVVCCPEGFWRKGNVDVVCARYGITPVDSLPELIHWVRAAVAP